MTTTRRLRLGLVAAAVLVAAGCSSNTGEDPEGAAGVPPPPPEHMEPVGPGPAGEVLHAEELDGRAVGGQVWRVLYRSEDAAGDPIGVTGIIARPDGPAPAGGYPVLTYGHGTAGVADACAPSRQGAGGVFGLEGLLDAGYVVAATDYEGLGTPGVHPYLVARSEGRSMIDAARAARDLVADATARVVVLGGSQGGHAALAAASLPDAWGDDLELVGTVAVAPAADVAALVDTAFTDSLAAGFAVLVAAGWSDHYDDLAADEVLTSAGVRLAERAADELCVTDVFAAVQRAGGPIVATRPAQLPPWRERMRENSISADAVVGPVLVVHGSADEIIPRGESDELHAELCAAGVSVTYQVYDGADHGSVSLAAAADVAEWIQARLDGAPPPSTC